HRYARIVAHVLVDSDQRAEQRRLARIRISDQGDRQRRFFFDYRSHALKGGSFLEVILYYSHRRMEIVRRTSLKVLRSLNAALHRSPLGRQAKHQSPGDVGTTETLSPSSARKQILLPAMRIMQGFPGRNISMQVPPRKPNSSKRWTWSGRPRIRLIRAVWPVRN